MPAVKASREMQLPQMGAGALAGLRRCAPTVAALVLGTWPWLAIAAPRTPRRPAVRRAVAASPALLRTPGTGPEQEAIALKAVGLLQQHCFECHGEDQQRSSLALHSRAGLLKGGQRGPILVKNSVQGGRLWKRLNHLEMPGMPFGGARLPAEDLATLRRWLELGAPYPASLPRPGAEWWAYQPIRRPDVPAVKDAGWVRNPIDAFILARLEKEGLSPAPAAEPRVLARRVYLDLVGLPPLPEETAAFVESGGASGYEALVDDLLGFPHFGEKWARKWLDLVRYSDTAGLERDRERPDAWRYRDWVIAAFNRDQPYSQFVREQLAADELEGRTPASLAALGFLACGPAEDDARPAYRPDELDDLLGTVTSVFLAQSVACARCHNHKYDDIPQRDYYRFAALFAGIERRRVEIADREEYERVRVREAEVEIDLRPVRAELAALEAPYRVQLPLDPQGKPDEKKLDELIQGPDKELRTGLQARIRSLEARRIQPSAVFAAQNRDLQPPPTYFLMGGEENRRGREVRPGFLSVLTGGKEVLSPPPAGAASPYRRRALADWITAEDNPLAARVIVNRLWQWHFGRGLVATPSDFGMNGAQPSHPELLDWLASELIRGGWKLKPLHRLMVTSNTYRQATRATQEARSADPDNALLGRMPLRRMEGEELRDSILFVSGALNEQAGGPGVRPPVDPSLTDGRGGDTWRAGPDDKSVWRRSIYVYQKRSLQLPILAAFDCPDGNSSQPVRERTTVVTQALSLLNDTFIRRMGSEMAERLRRDVGPGLGRRQIQRAFQLVFCRLPEVEEEQSMLDFLTRQRAVYAAPRPAPRRRPGSPLPPASPTVPADRRALEDFCVVLLNSSEFLYVE